MLTILDWNIAKVVIIELLNCSKRFTQMKEYRKWLMKITPLLKANGYTQEQIEQAKECVNKHNKELEAQDHNDY